MSRSRLTFQFGANNPAQIPFPPGAPTWSAVTVGALPIDPPPFLVPPNGTTVFSLTTPPVGLFTITATCGSSSESFILNVISPAGCIVESKTVTSGAPLAVVVTNTDQLYNVSGDTVAAIGTSLTANTTVTPNLGQTALTPLTPSAPPSSTRTPGTPVQLADGSWRATVTLGITSFPVSLNTDLPNLLASATRPAAITTQFNTFLTNLRTHETGHADSFAFHLSRIATLFNGGRGIGCAATAARALVLAEQAVTEEADRIFFTEMQQAGNNYDAPPPLGTNGGGTQGATFPPP